MKYPNFREEKKLWKKGYKCIVGLDEVGRGSLSGPVVAAAVMFKNSKFQFPKVKDSKQLSAKKREEFYKLFIKHPRIKWGTGRVSEKVIDRINILEATKLAMKRAIKNLEFRQHYEKCSRSVTDYLIIDGNFKTNLPLLQKSIIKGDEKVFSCAAASIIAKVFRDRIMKRYDKKYPQYGFAQHKGYPTKKHVKLLKKYGRCDIHRNSFNYYGCSKTKTH